jgi:hypothetical protein
MTATREELLDALERLCDLRPSVRFGQLLSNLASLAEMRPEAVWLVEDDRLLAEARDELAGLRERRVDPHAPSRVELFEALRLLDSRVGGERLGETIAGLVNAPGPSATPLEQAGRIWEIEDGELVEAIHSRPGIGPTVGNP